MKQLQQSQTVFQETLLSIFEQSLTEEQRFLQNVVNGNINLIQHEEVMQKLELVLKNGLKRE